MEHLFSIVGSAIATSMQKKLRDLDVWKAPFEEVQTELNSGIGVCERWCEASSELTNIWKEGTDVRLWEGVDYHDKYVLSLSCRFKKVLDLRRTCKEIHRLQMDQMDIETTKIPSRHFAKTRRSRQIDHVRSATNLKSPLTPN